MWKGIVHGFKWKLEEKRTNGQFTIQRKPVNE